MLIYVRRYGSFPKLATNGVQGWGEPQRRFDAGVMSGIEDMEA
jgi:hypothetical protein